MKLLTSTIAMLLLLSLMITAFAASGTKDIPVTFRDIKVKLQGGARQVIDVTEDLKDVTGKKVEPFIYDGTTYVPIRGISEALGLDVEWDGENNTVNISGFAPYYRSVKRDYDVIPIKMYMQAGYNEIEEYTSGRTIHSGEGYIDPFGVGTYHAGIGYSEANDYPQDRYFSEWWMQNFDTGLFCVYHMKDGDIYAWDGILGRIKTNPGDGTANQSDALVNIIVGGTGSYAGATGILVGYTQGSGKNDPESTLPQALFKIMEGFIKLPKNPENYKPPEVTQTIGEYEKLQRTDTSVYTTYAIDMTMKAGSHEYEQWTSGFWTIHSGIGVIEPYGQSSYHAGKGYAEEKFKPDDFFNDNWLEEFGTDLFCIYHIGDLGDIYVYDGLWSYILEEEDDCGIGDNAQRQDALINIIIGGTGAFEGATGILVGKTMGAGEKQQVGFMPKEIVGEENKVPYDLPETLLKIMSGYIRVPANSSAAVYGKK
ncbi:MAG: stalk domain-containing protein [Oscillospiraceae bacterium]